ncbi:MAG: hypothetical protein L3J35_05855 [Bacteroidales bacterium]|nr:hypothetical protein [Bacteroidales bacterium]
MKSSGLFLLTVLLRLFSVNYGGSSSSSAYMKLTELNFADKGIPVTVRASEGAEIKNGMFMRVFGGITEKTYTITAEDFQNLEGDPPDSVWGFSLTDIEAAGGGKAFFEMHKDEIQAYADANGIKYNGNPKFLLIKFNSEFKIVKSKKEIANIDKNIENIDKNIENDKKEIANIDKNIENIDKNIENIDKNIENIDKNIENIDKNIENIDKNIEDMNNSMVQNLKNKKEKPPKE